MRHILMVLLVAGGPMLKCTGAHATDASLKRGTYKMTCDFVRKQLIDVAFDDSDSFDTYNMVDQGVFNYMCSDEFGTTDKSAKLCKEAKQLKCGGL